MMIRFCSLYEKSKLREHLKVTFPNFIQKLPGNGEKSTSEFFHILIVFNLEGRKESLSMDVKVYFYL